LGSSLVTTASDRHFSFRVGDGCRALRRSRAPGELAVETYVKAAFPAPQRTNVTRATPKPVSQTGHHGCGLVHADYGHDRDRDLRGASRARPRHIRRLPWRHWRSGGRECRQPRVGIAIGTQDSFSFNAVAISALGAGALGEQRHVVRAVGAIPFGLQQVYIYSMLKYQSCA
jgi:hypothetical protein